MSGVFEGKTTGTPISIIIYNEDKKSRDYETIKNKFRPNMLIIPLYKYGIRDYRGWKTIPPGKLHVELLQGLSQK